MTRDESSFAIGDSLSIFYKPIIIPHLTNGSRESTKASLTTVQLRVFDRLN